MCAKKYTVWQNYDLDFEYWKDDLREDYPEYDDDELYQIMVDINTEYLRDERCNLDIDCDDEIIIIGDLGLWNGRVTGYRETDTTNIGELLYLDSDCDYGEWYVDRYGNFRSTQSHHDGTNCYLYRSWKPGLSEQQRENFLDAIYYGKVTSKMITRYTKSVGKLVKQVYGW